MNTTIISRKQSVIATNISVQFISSLPLNLAIKHPTKNTKKKTARNPIRETQETNVRRTLQNDLDSLQLTESPLKKNDRIFGPPRHSPHRLKNLEFRLEAPMARSVKLAADFTDWDRFPLDMIQAMDGIWWTVVPLLPGKYTYRFIVDGQWCDDPENHNRIQNSFGTSNAVVQVI